MDVREQILRASIEVIEKEGLASLSMREVARRAGVSHQAPYHYFTDREAILAAIAGDGFRQLADALESALTSTRGDSLSRLNAGGRTYVRFAITRSAHFRLMFRPDVVDIEQYPEAKAQAERAYAALEQLVGAAVGEGFLPARLAQGTVVLSWAFVHGLSSLFLDGPLSEDEAIESAFAAFDNFLRRPQRKKTR